MENRNNAIDDAKNNFFIIINLWFNFANIRKKMKNTISEENYLKTIFNLSQISNNVTTNAIAEVLNTKASSVTSMLIKLSSKELILHKKYQGVKLTEKGKKEALKVIRKHRLWESFLVDYLNFKWDEVHDIAEELEHIQSNELIERLDDFLGNPEFDPHGDPIPNKSGDYLSFKKTLVDLKKNDEAIIAGIKSHNNKLLKYLDKIGLIPGTEIKVMEIRDFDKTMLIRYKPYYDNKEKKELLSAQIVKNLFIKK